MIVSQYAVHWRFYGCTDWVTELVWAITLQEAKRKVASSNPLIQLKGQTLNRRGI